MGTCRFLSRTGIGSTRFRIVERVLVRRSDARWPMAGIATGKPLGCGGNELHRRNRPILELCPRHLEYWNVGVAEELGTRERFCLVPLLHYSITPLLQGFDPWVKLASI